MRVPFAAACRRQLFVLAALLPLPGVVASCGGGGDQSTAPEAAPTITLNSSALTMQGSGASASLTAVVSPASASVTWTSNRPDIVSVASNGSTATLSAVAPGAAVITAQANSGSRSAQTQATVQVVPIVHSIAIDATNTALLLGQSTTLRARVNADQGVDTTVRWTSSTPAVASIDAAGVVTALTPGTTNIQVASSIASTITASVTISVAAPVVRSINVVPSLDTLIIGATKQFSATVTADDGLATGVTWTSSASSVATVANDGRVTAIAAGTAQITAQSIADASRRATATAVVRMPEVLAITLATQQPLRERDQRILQASVNAEAGADARVLWTTADATVATIDANGTLSAMRAGTTTITARSMAFPQIRADRTLNVVAAAPFASWSAQTAGIVGTLRAEGTPLSMVSRNSQRAMFTMMAFNWPFPYDTVTYSLDAGAWTRVGGPGTGSPAITGLTNHVNEEVIGWGGAFVADRQIYKWNGSWQAIAKLPVGVFDGLGGPQSLPGGQIATKGRDGGFDQIMLWNGSAWTELRRWGRQANYQGGLLWMTSSTAGFLHQNFAGGYHVTRYDAPNTMTLLPAPPTNSLFFAEFRGSRTDSLFAHGGGGDDRIHRWNGTAWTFYDKTWPSNDFIATFDMCGGIPVVLTISGRVYRLENNQFRQLGTDNDVLSGEGSIGERLLSCAPDGTIRNTAGSGAIARWTGSAWTLEAFTPKYTAVSAASSSLAWAGSNVARIYRWSGGNWEESYRSHAVGDVGSIRSIASWADGRVVALLNGTTMLRRDAGVWREETGSELVGVNAVWGPSADLVFAVREDGRIIRSVNGGAWQPISPAGAALRSIDGLGSRHAIATGASLRTMRWDGDAWTEVVTTVAGTFNADRLHVSSLNDAWIAASGTSGQTTARIYRFNGTTWSQVDAAAIGGSDAGTGTKTLAMFGTGPSNVYALRGNARGPRSLYRFNGTAWSTVTQLSAGYPDWVSLGSGVPGFALIAGSRGELHVSRPVEP